MNLKIYLLIIEKKINNIYNIYKIIENISYTLGELKAILDRLNLPVEVSLFRKTDFNNTNPKIFLIQ